MSTQFVEREYQQQALYGGREFPGVFNALRSSLSALLVIATGGGKSYVAAKVIEPVYKKGNRTLFLAHRRNLIEQMHRGLLATGIVDQFDVGVEMSEHRANLRHQVVIASKDSLKNRLNRYPPDHFGMIIVDEAHHCHKSSGYMEILDHFPKARRLGLTATPTRPDAYDIRDVFEVDAFVYDLLDAVKERFLVPPILFGAVSKDINLKSVEKSNGSYDIKALGDMMSRDPVVAFVAAGIVKSTAERRTMVFTVTTVQAIGVCDYINHLEPGTARWVCGQGTNVPDGYHATTSRELEENVAWLVEKPGRRLINCQLFTEGTDIPAVDCIAVARPARNVSFLAQIVGRGTRLLGATWEDSVANGKKDVLVLDFTGATAPRDTRRPVSVLDLMEGNGDEDVRERALAKSQEGPVDAMTVLDEAAAELLAEERTKALEDVTYRAVAMGDPFVLLGVGRRSGKLGGKPATEHQLRVLADHKIPGASAQLKAMDAGRTIKKGGIDFGQAQELQAAIARRRKAGLCSPRQAKQLIQRGLNPDAKGEAAGAAMHLFSNNGTWRPVSESAVADLLIRWPGLAPKAAA